MTVKIAVGVLSVGFGLGFVNLVAVARLEAPLAYVTLAVILGILALWVWLIFRGKNWARLLLFIFLGLGLLWLPKSIRKIPSLSGFEVVLSCMKSLLQFAAGALLCTRSARKWFRREGGVTEGS